MANPISWVKSKFKKKESVPTGTTPEAQDAAYRMRVERDLRAAEARSQGGPTERASQGLPEGTPRRGSSSTFWKEQTERQYREFKREEELRRQEQASREKTQKEYEDYKKAHPESTSKPEDLLSKLSPKDRKRYEAQLKRSREEEAKARLEAEMAGVGTEPETQYQRTYIPGYTPTTDFTDAQGVFHAKGVYIPGEYKYIPIKGPPLTPAQIKYKTLMQTEQIEQLQSARRARKWAPYKRTAQVAGTVAKEIVGTAMMGVAGTAQVIQPGRGAYSKAQRNLTPQAPTSVYYLSRPDMDLSGVKQAVAPNTSIIRNLTAPTGGVSPVSPRTNVTGSRRSPAGRKLRLW